MKIRLTQEAYLDGTNDNAYFTACAEDAEGRHYDVYWDIKDFNSTKADDEQDVDWDTPSGIIAIDDNRRDVTADTEIEHNEFYGGYHNDNNNRSLCD